MANTPPCSENHHTEIVHSNHPPLIYSRNETAYADTVNAFRKAEKCLKIVEWQDGELDIPAVNELRYVGNHLFNALYCDNELEQHEQLKRAERHCKRASYDAIELGLIDLLEKVSHFHEKYQHIQITDVIPDYLEIMKKVRSAQDLMQKTPGESRDEYYGIAETQLISLKSAWTTLEISQIELNKKINNLQKAELRAKKAEERAEIAEKKMKNSNLIAGVAVIVMLVVGIPNLYNFFSIKPIAETQASQKQDAVKNTDAKGIREGENR